MATKIPWATETVNPWVGCTKVNVGCANCYAERQAIRVCAMAAERGANDTWATYSEALKWDYSRSETGKAVGWNGTVSRQAGQIEKVLKKRRHPTRFFWGSMTDIFHEKVPFEWILEIFGVSMLTPWHSHLILTKRPERTLEFFKWWNREWEKSRILWGLQALALEAVKKYGGEKLRDKATKYWESNFDQSGRGKCDYPVPWPHPNIWFGISCSTQNDLDRMAPIALQIPAAVRFISYEPALEDIDLTGIFIRTPTRPKNSPGYYISAFPGFHWVIIGSESGPKRRPCSIEAIRKAVRQCRAANVAVFVKQIEINGKCEKDPAKWPEDLRIQEYPSNTGQDSGPRFGVTVPFVKE